MNADQPKTMTPVRVRLALLGVMFGLLLSMLDNFIVGTALPSIVRDLHGAALLAWVVTAYTLTTAVTTPIWGKLGDLYGRKRTFQISVTVFVVGSVLAALSPRMGLLIASRALQGIGAGGLAVGAFAVIGDLVPPRERGRYQGMVAIVVAAGTLGGPLLGGFLTDAFGWRSAFLINLPLGIVTIVWVAVTLHITGTRRRARIDWTGALLLSAAVAAVVLLTTWAGNDFAWASWQTVALAVVAALALAAFIVRERRAAEPILPLGIFRSRSFTMAAALAFSTGVITFAAVLYLPLFQQNVQRVSASASGLLLLPMMIPIIVVAQIAGRVMTRTGRYRVFPIVGAVSSVVGAILLATMSPATPIVLTSFFMIFMGIGMGLTQQMTTTIAQNSVEQRDIGAASGAITLLRTLGGSLGVAVFSTVYTAHTTGVAAGAASRAGIADAVDIVFVIVAGLAALATVAAFAIKEQPLRGAPTSTPAPAPVAATPVG